MPAAATLERHVRGHWVPIASVALSADPAGGIATPTVTTYETGYASENLERRDAAALSAAMPVTLDALERSRWPAFLVDLLPQGHGRTELLRQMGPPEHSGRPADWLLLLAGAGNPVGHLRVREAWEWLAARSTPAPAEGFSFEEVAAHSDDFLELLTGHGLLVVGASGVQGEWPKILLAEDARGRLHLDHTLPDEQARAHWLVKLGRGPDPQLARILELEAPYMRLARRLGARVHGELAHRHRALFIPRFDRRVRGSGLERIAQESLASLAGVADLWVALAHDTAVGVLAQVVTDPQGEVIEYVRRDVLNLLLGNRDNHAHNTAVQRFEDGRIGLSPLYDFAPMMLHPGGMARLARWDGEVGLSPDLRGVIEQCRQATGLPLPGLPVALRELATHLGRLPEHAAHAGIPPDILERQKPSVDAVLEALRRV